MKFFVALCLYAFPACVSLKVNAPHVVVSASDSVSALGVSASNQHVAHVRAINSRATSTKLLWLLGCSIDNQAFIATCLNAHADIMPGHWRNNTMVPPYETKWCSFDDLTIVFSFHPGATPPPYFDYVDFNSTTQESVKTGAEFIRQRFGRSPDATVVDSSLWDAANWWRDDGLPQNWSAPVAKIHDWSTSTIPEFLKLVQDTIPSTHVAFRSPPPVFRSCDAPRFMWMCSGPEIVEEMYRCLLKEADITTLQIYGKYHFVDYYKLVHVKNQLWGGSLRDLYADDAHPGEKLATAYMSEVLSWARRL